MPVVEEVEEEPVYRTAYCYDPDTDSWSSISSCPEWLYNASAAAFAGKLYVKGFKAELDAGGKIPNYDDPDEGEMRVYSYTPGETAGSNAPQMKYIPLRRCSARKTV